MERNLDIDVGGEFGGGRFSASAAAQFANSSKSDQYHTNILYLFKYAGTASFKNGSLKQGDEALTPVAQSFVHSNQIRFREMCGDSYVEQMDAGGVLAVRLTLSFNSHADKEKLRTELGADFGLGNIAGEIKKAAENKHVHVGFSLSAIQLGGEPQKLNELFGSHSSTGNYPFIDCGDIQGHNNDACNKMITSIIDYSQTINQQLTTADNKLKLDNLYYTNPVVSNYKTLGIVVGAPDPSNEVFQAMHDLTKNYDKTLYDYTFVNHYLTTNYLNSKLDVATKNSLTTARKLLAAQLNNVYLSPVYGVLNCYKGYVSDKCIEIKSHVDAGLKNYALDDTALTLMDYLEKTSYSANLYSYIDNGLKKSNCTLSPVSAPNKRYYILNCDGSWLNARNNIVMQYDFLRKTLTTTGLEYLSYDGQKYRVVAYPDTSLNPDSFFPNEYNDNDVTLKVHDQGETNDNKVEKIKTELKITKLDENQA